MENIIMLILGVFISVVGIVNIKGNISTIHSYNRRRVKEEDIPKYTCKSLSVILRTIYSQFNSPDSVSKSLSRFFLIKLYSSSAV